MPHRKKKDQKNVIGKVQRFRVNDVASAVISSIKEGYLTLKDFEQIIEIVKEKINPSKKEVK